MYGFNKWGIFFRVIVIVIINVGYWVIFFFTYWVFFLNFLLRLESRVIFF